ncbi:MAG: sulfatase/phosphatase domain-containing protein, partial [Verrucomicrobiota bacterium]
IATPLIAHWPARITAHGKLRQQVGHIIDIMPTCLEVAGATYPKEFNGQAILPLEGTSLVPAFEDNPLTRDALYWEHEGNAAIRAGDWKLVRLTRNGPWELYNLKTDRTELHDLAASEPQRVGDLVAQWQAWAARTHVNPSPHEGKNAAKGVAPNKPNSP